MESIKANIDPVYIFCKDRHGRFMFCNEPFAEIMGVDSSSSVIGKTDFQACWRIYAELYREGDCSVMAGGVWQNVHETQNHADGNTYNILVSKYPFFDKNDEVIGVIGSYSKIPQQEYTNTARALGSKFEKDKIYLGANFGSEYFTKREYEVFQQLLLSKSIKQIAFVLNISARTVESHVNKIKNKLQCNYKNDIVVTAVRFGLLHI